MNTDIHLTKVRAGRSWALLALLPMSLPALLLTLFLAGCAKGPPPNLYMLDLPLSAEMAGIEKGVAVGVGPVEFPQYLDRPQIITRDGVHRLQASDAHVWAEPVKISASRVLVVTIAAALGSNRIYLMPRRVRTTLDWRVMIDVGRFDGAIGGDVLLAVRWGLYRGDDKEVSLSRVSIIEEPVAEESYAALVAAQSRALTRLGKEIAAAIKVNSR